MAIPWYRRLFSPPNNAVPDPTRIKADAGDAEAQFALGLRYGCAAGAARDLGQAVIWYRRAAEQNHSLAEFNLGVMYAEGQGVVRDTTEAGRWLRRAAEHGDAGAQFGLGNHYERASLTGLAGEAAEARVEAYKWYRRAASQGYGQSHLACETLSLGMTREQMDEGDRRAASSETTPATLPA